MEIPRIDAFPAGLRVLAVDDDVAFLKILETMLKKCSYTVTTFCLSRDALNLLRERKRGFDIVIIDVNMPYMDGFQLLEHVRIEMDLPVIMMSVDGEVSRVMKCIENGACDYLLKPIRMEELRNIWQHAIRKQLNRGDNIQVIKSRLHEFHDGDQIETTAMRKRKYMEDKRHKDDPSTSKKARVVWSEELHQKFVEATTQLGFDKAKPKKILDLMNVEWLTREHVASHLQKCRCYLSKLRKENEVKTFEGMTQKDFSHPASSFGFQTSTLMHPKDAANCNPEYRDNNTLLIETSTISCPEADMKTTPSADTSQTSLSHPFNFQPWNEIPMEQFKQPPNQDPDLYALLYEDFSHALQSSSQNLIQVDPQCSAYTVGLGTSIGEKDKPDSVMIEPLCSQSGSGHGQTVNPEISDAISSSNVGMTNQMVNVNSLNDCEPTQQSCEPTSSKLGSLVECASTETIWAQDVSNFDYSDAELFAELDETYFSDDLGFEWDWLPLMGV